MAEVTNRDRARWARKGVDAFAKQVYGRPGEEPLDQTIGDFLADMMHLADQADIDFEAALERGRGYYQEELADERAGRKEWDPRHLSGATLGAATVPTEVREVVEHIASVASGSYRGAVAREYAMALLQDPRATESTEAVRVQLIYLRSNLGWWKGPEAKEGKKILDRAIKDLR